jgi:hypothetical protein
MIGVGLEPPGTAVVRIKGGCKCNWGGNKASAWRTSSGCHSGK